MEELELIKSKIKEIKEELINIRRDLHSNPELSEKEFQTMNTISNHLKKYNIEHKTEVANTGIIADIKGEDKSFTVAFRADIDALPIDDLKNCSYRSKNKGVCHACGHDIHTAINLGIASVFQNNSKGIIPPCNIRLIFQPAEETVGGALRMIKENALENVNVIYGLHVSTHSDIGFVQINDNISQEPINYTDSDFFQKVDEKILSPYRGFLEKNTEKDNVEFFERAAQKKLGNETILKKDSLFILLPAFTMGQLEAAFKIGFLLYLPFIAIDLIISNILLALGMMMVSPVTISIPFKILLFILVGGWQKLFEFLLVVN